MAIVLNYTPVAYSSMHGDLLFTAYNATNVAQPGYKYICDVYIGATLYSRLKSFPNPANNNGIFNIGSTVRNYIATQLSPTVNQLRAQEFGLNDFYLDVTCKFGEEYGGTLYTNLLVDSTRRYYNYYNGRLLSNQAILPNYLDLAASNRPYENKVIFGDVYTFIPYFPTTAAAIALQVTTYPNGTVYNTTITPTAANNLQLLNLSPTAINAFFAGSITGNTSYYTVKIGATSIYKFVVDCEPKYTNYVVHFMNQFGGYESFNFQKVSKKSYDIERKDFTQLPYRMDSNGIVSFANANNVLYDTKTIFAARYKEKLLLNSDLLSDGQYKWLRELILSPSMFIEDSGYFVPITISDVGYTQKKIVTDKLTNLSINVEYGEVYNSQYR